MGIIDDVITHLDTNWNIVVTPKPKIQNGDKEDMWEALNYVYVYNNGADFEDATSDGTKRNRTESILLIVGSSYTEAKRNLMLSEVERICSITITNYDYNTIVSQDDSDDSDSWVTLLTLEIYKFLEAK